jgi:hypothetical protein
MPDKQTIQTSQGGLTVTWNRDTAGAQSAKETSDFLVGSVKALEDFKKRDPRLWPRTRRALKIIGLVGLGAAAGIAGMALVSAPQPAPTPKWQLEAGAIPDLPVAQKREPERTETMETLAAAKHKPAERAVEAPAPNEPPELVKAKRHLSTSVFDYLVHKTRVAQGRAEFRDNPNGTHEVLVPVSWHVDSAPVMAALDTYFWNVDHGPLETQVDFSSDFNPLVPGTVINRHFNQNHNRKFPYAEQLLDWLSSWQLRIVVALGHHSGFVTLASGREYSLIKCKGVGRDQYQFQFNHDVADKTLLFSNMHTEQDPLVLAHVPAAARDALGDVESHVEWTKLP